MRIVVPGTPPSVNHMYRRFTNKRGQTMDVTTKKAADWMKHAAQQAAQAAKQDGWECVSLGTKVVVRLWFYWPNRQRRDTHNALKALLDAWEGVLYEDDRNALPRIMDYAVDRENPRIEAEVELLEAERREAG